MSQKSVEYRLNTPRKLNLQFLTKAIILIKAEMVREEARDN